MKHHILILLFLSASLCHVNAGTTDEFEDLVYATGAYCCDTIEPGERLHMDLKTNMLYDALLLPNIGVELHVGKNWSVFGDWMYGWWDRDRAHWYWRAYGGTVGVRRWLGRKAAEKPLTGHHLGVFAGAVTYDFEFGHGGVMGGLPRRSLWNRCNFISGVEYGYSMPIGRRLNLDFSLALGYMGGKYLKYEPEEGVYMWKSTHRLNWFGPTKAEVSLVWLIGPHNFNRRKESPIDKSENPVEP